MGRRATAGLVLCAFLLGATWPSLAALPSLPVRVLAGNVYAVTQGSGPLSVNESLARAMDAEAWASAVSPEILGLGTIRGDPVILRGADPGRFLTIEAGVWVEPPIASGRGAFAGLALASRLGLRTGDFVALVGSTEPKMDVVPVLGIFRVEGPGSDEILVDLATARFLTDVGSTSYHSVRLKTQDPAALVAFLERSGASVHVYGPGLGRLDVRSDPPPAGDDRLANLLLRSGSAPLAADGLTAAVDQAANSVRVVAFGIAALLGLLVAFGIHALLGRAFADKRKAVGILRAMGAPAGWMGRRIVSETLPLALGAGTAGAGLGVLAAALLRPTASVVLFGHTLSSPLDVTILVAAALAIAFVSVASALLHLAPALRSRPMDSLREADAVATPPALEVVLRG